MAWVVLHSVTLQGLGGSEEKTRVRDLFWSSSLSPTQGVLPFSPRSLGTQGLDGSWNTCARRVGSKKMGVIPICFIFFSVIVNLNVLCLLPASLLLLNPHTAVSLPFIIPQSPVKEAKQIFLLLFLSLPLAQAHSRYSISAVDQQLRGFPSPFPFGLSSYWKHWHFCV